MGFSNLRGWSVVKMGERECLAHGEYTEWLEKSINMNPTTAQRFVKIASELPDQYSGTDLGWESLYEIVTMPKSERDKSQQLDFYENACLINTSEEGLNFEKITLVKQTIIFGNCRNPFHSSNGTTDDRIFYSHAKWTAR